MNSLQIYDPAMCCSSGVCGPNVDPRLLRLSSDVGFLKSRGIDVERFNLAHQPEAFTNQPQVLERMGEEAENLPIFIVNGEIVAVGRYPGREELADWFGLEAGTTHGKPMVSLHQAEVLSPKAVPNVD